MATKKKNKSTKLKITARKKAIAVKPAKRSKKVAKKAAPKRVEKKKAASKKQARNARRPPVAPASSRPAQGPDSGQLAGDLQGLSRREAADSESVDELLEEGNAFEAGAVMGVEEAGSEDGREVHTHGVPEDDVPEEYLDEN